MVLGWVLLVPFCLAQAWETCDSTAGPYPVRKIDRWKWKPLNAIYGNPEDGVSGQCALVWYWDGVDAHSAVQIPYRPGMWAPLRAWLWSAWRNSTNQLTR
jgi:hypothetical protein